jgi:DNA-binding NarL/FixJ family response regulator
MEKLTKKQTEIVQLLSQGKTVEEIAAERHRSIHTVRKHIYLAMDSLGALTVIHLVAKAIQHGHIHF